MQQGEHFRQSQNGSNINSVGIGCEIEKLGDYHVVSHVYNDGPAYAAGLYQGCIIRAIDFRPVKAFDTQRLQSMIFGPYMSKVTLTIQRPGYDEIEDITVARNYQEKSNQDQAPNPVGDWFNKVLGIFQQSPSGSQRMVISPSAEKFPKDDPIQTAHGPQRTEYPPELNRRSFPMKASALETSGTSRPITYPLSVSPANNSRQNREEEVQQGIDRLRAQTTHAALALDSVVEDILRRRTQRLNALEQAGRDSAAYSPDRAAAAEPGPGHPFHAGRPIPRDDPKPPAYTVVTTNGDARHRDAQLPDPAPTPFDAVPPGFTTPYADRSGPSRPGSAAEPMRPAMRSILSVAGHPLLYRSPPEATAETPADAGGGGEDGAEATKHELEQKLRSMEEAVRALSAEPKAADGTDLTPRPLAAPAPAPAAAPPALDSGRRWNAKASDSDEDGRRAVPASEGLRDAASESNKRVTAAPSVGTRGPPPAPAPSVPDARGPPETALGRLAGTVAGVAGFLRVDVFQARDLPKMDVLTGSSDPYCQITVGNTTVVTKSIKQTTSPLWNEAFTFPLDGPAAAAADSVRLTVFDWNRLMKHAPMGEVVVPLRDIRLDDSGRGQPAWYPLTRPEHGKAATAASVGSIYLQFSSAPTALPTPVAEPPAAAATTATTSAAAAAPSSTARLPGPPQQLPPSAGAPASLPAAAGAGTASQAPAATVAAASTATPPTAVQPSPAIDSLPSAAAAVAAPSPQGTPLRTAQPALASPSPASAAPAQVSQYDSPTPSGLPARTAVATAAAAAAAAAAPSPLQDQAGRAATGPAGLGAAEASPGDSGGGLGDGWQEHWSKTKGKPYYSNRLTGETRWTRPTAAAATTTAAAASRPI